MICSLLVLLGMKDHQRLLKHKPQVSAYIMVFQRVALVLNYSRNFHLKSVYKNVLALKPKWPCKKETGTTTWTRISRLMTGENHLMEGEFLCTFYKMETWQTTDPPASQSYDSGLCACLCLKTKPKTKSFINFNDTQLSYRHYWQTSID